MWGLHFLGCLKAYRETGKVQPSLPQEIPTHRPGTQVMPTAENSPTTATPTAAVQLNRDTWGHACKRQSTAFYHLHRPAIYWRGPRGVGGGSPCRLSVQAFSAERRELQAEGP